MYILRGTQCGRMVNMITAKIVARRDQRLVGGSVQVMQFTSMLHLLSLII